MFIKVKYVMKPVKELLGLLGSVVEKLTSSLHYSSFVITMDSYFTSLKHVEYSKAQGVYACGTLRPNSVGPLKPTGDKDLKRGRILLANF
jgi:hypothetical protein